MTAEQWADLADLLARAEELCADLTHDDAGNEWIGGWVSRALYEAEIRAQEEERCD